MDLAELCRHSVSMYSQAKVTVKTIFENIERMHRSLITNTMLPG